MELPSIGVVLVFGIILMPIIILIFASIFGKPRNLRVTGMFLGLFGGLLLLGIVAIWLLTTLLSFVTP